MDFSLDIGELTATIKEYENFIKILAEQKENINKAIKELTDLGWSGAAKDKFVENHIEKQEFYTKLEEDVEYMKSALESEEKPRAVRLKKQSEDFVNCIKRSGGGAALTSDDAGLISLQYGGQFPINNNVNECTNDYYKKMDSKFIEILNLVNSLTFTSFSIGEDIEKARKSLKDQTTSLTDFNDSFNEYCSGVKTMESNICSVLGKISGITEGISKFRGISIISEGGQVDKDKVVQLMLKNPSGLTNEEKEMLAYLEKVLGEKKYAELKEQVIKGEEIKSSTFDDIATSPKTSGVVGSIDRSIAANIEKVLGKGTKISFNELSENLKKLGYDRSYRRNLLRDIPKEARNIELELPKGLKLAKGFGIATTALAGLTFMEDYKNNDTGIKRAEAIGIDAAVAGGAYVATNVAVATVTAIGAVVAAPEIVVVGACVVAAGLIGYGASKASSWFKGLKRLR